MESLSSAQPNFETLHCFTSAAYLIDSKIWHNL